MKHETIKPRAEKRKLMTAEAAGPGEVILTSEPVKVVSEQPKKKQKPKKAKPPKGR